MIIEAIRKGAYKLTISHDEDIPNPRLDCDSFGKMICWHGRYNLGDPHDYKNSSDFLISLIETHVGDIEQAEKIFERICETSDPTEREGNILRIVQDSHIVLPLYLYDHSVQIMSTTSFSGYAHAAWDSGRVGFIYAEKSDVVRDFGVWDANTRRKAAYLLKGEVSYYSSYLNGEGYRYDLRKDGDLVDSAGGFLGSVADVKRSIADCLPDELKSMVVKPARTAKTSAPSL